MNSSLTLSINWKITLLGLLFLPLLLGLGAWQLQRADYKRELLAEEQRQQALPPLDLNQHKSADQLPAYRRASAEGRLLAEQYFLLDNRVLRGRVGYEVLVPLVLGRGTTLLVNLGWVAAPPLRSQLPELNLASGPARLQGQIHHPSGGRTDVAAGIEDQRWPRRIQALDLEPLQRQLRRPLLPVVLRLDESHPLALPSDWQVINSSPAKHLGYAVQWFALAATLLVALVFANSNLAAVLRGRGRSPEKPT